jgi:hypothetical protein
MMGINVFFVMRSLIRRLVISRIIIARY